MFQGLQPWLRYYAAWLYELARANGLRPVVTSVYRSYEKQRMLHEKWLRGELQIYAAPPGQSYHQYGLAFDMTCTDPAWLGSVWKQMGGKWWSSDAVHYQV